MTLTILQNAFLPPNPLTPRLTALGLNNKTAEVISRLYSSAALVLKEKYEAEYIGACNSIVATSESHGYSSKELRFKLLKVLTTRYTQEISKQMEEAFRMVGARFPKGYKNRAHMEVRTSDPYEDLKWLPENDDPKVVTLVHVVGPDYAFPCTYPPLVRPEPVTFITQVPRVVGELERLPTAAFDDELEACTDALSRLSLGPSSRLSKSSRKLFRVGPKPQQRTPTLSPPRLDTSVAASHKPLATHAPSYPSPTNMPCAQKVDIPRSNRRKACSIPYRRPMMHPPTSPKSPSSPPFSCSIHHTPSLVSDHGSEASSPSMPPDFPSMPMSTPTLARKDSFPEAMSSLEYSPVRHSGWHGIDFGIDLCG